MIAAHTCGIPILNCGGIGIAVIAFNVAVGVILVRITRSVGREIREKEKK